MLKVCCRVEAGRVFAYIALALSVLTLDYHQTFIMLVLPLNQTSVGNVHPSTSSPT